MNTRFVVLGAALFLSNNLSASRDHAGALDALELTVKFLQQR